MDNSDVGWMGGTVLGPGEGREDVYDQGPEEVRRTTTVRRVSESVPRPWSSRVVVE